MNINLINSYYYSLPWIDIKILSIKKNTVIRIKKKNEFKLFKVYSCKICSDNYDFFSTTCKILV